MEGTHANALLIARIRGGSYPPDGVPDTPENKKLWDSLGEDLAAMQKKGIRPQVSWDYTEISGRRGQSGNVKDG